MAEPIPATHLLRAALREIERELCRVQWNHFQEEYESPFANTGNRFECPAFAVHAYNWNESENQEWNFRWRDVRVSWYKYLGRGTMVNRLLTESEIGELLDDCLAALVELEQEYDRQELEQESRE